MNKLEERHSKINFECYGMIDWVNASIDHATLTKEIAIGFHRWEKGLNQIERCTVHPPAGSGGSHGIYLKTDSELFEMYLNTLK